ADVGFANLAGGDYHLAAGSPYKHAGTDGKDIGANIDALGTATAFAVSGINPAAQSAPPTVSITPAGTDFGTVTVGGSADRAFTVTNLGGRTASGTISSGASPPFSVVSGGSGRGKPHDHRLGDRVGGAGADGHRSAGAAAKPVGP